MAHSKDNGIIDTLSNHSVDQTVERLKEILETKGITLFAVIDHSGEAEKVRLKIAANQTDDLRQSKGWNSAYVSGSEYRD